MNRDLREDIKPIMELAEWASALSRADANYNGDQWRGLEAECCAILAEMLQAYSTPFRKGKTHV